MSSIKDSTGRTWRLIVTVGIYARLLDDEGIDLLDEKSIGDILLDPIKRSEVLIAILDRQAVKHGLSNDDVDEILCDPATAPPAHVALEEALQNFYETQGATAMTAVMKRISEAQKTLKSTAMSRINSDAMRRMIDREITKATTQMDADMAAMEATQLADDTATGSKSKSPSPVQPTGDV
jgi:hypothetical protein